MTTRRGATVMLGTALTLTVSRRSDRANLTSSGTIALVAGPWSWPESTRRWALRAVRLRRRHGGSGSPGKSGR